MLPACDAQVPRLSFFRGVTGDPQLNDDRKTSRLTLLADGAFSYSNGLTQRRKARKGKCRNFASLVRQAKLG